MTAKRKDEKQSLRTRAESQIEGELVDTSQFNELSSKSLVELVHELQVHQVELEIQNEELRRAQADLQNSRQRFADLFHRAPVGYLVLDGKGLVQDVNETFCNMTGRAPHLVRQQPVFNLIAEKDRSWFMARYKALYKKPDQKNMELSLLVEQGELLPVSLNAVLYAPASEGDSSSGSRLLVTLTDISERKRVEKTLHLQAAMLQNVAEGINLVGLDDGLIQYTNSRFETMFGYEPGEMLGEDIAIVNAPDIQSPKMTRDAIKAALERDGEWHGEVQNVKKDGTAFWCYANVSRFDHPDFGSSVISVHTDITDRKNAEHALQEQTELLATVFENSPNILMLVNADGRVEKINRAGSELSTSPREELLGLLGGEIFQCVNSFDGEGCGRNPECGNCPVRTRMMRSLRAGEMILNEEGSLTVRKESQEIVRDFLISTVPVTVAGQVKVLVTIVDITERKQAEDYMRRQAFLLENVSDAIISTDANFAIQTWNRAAEEIYGWKESEVLGKAVEDVLRSEFKEPLKKILENFYQEGIWRGETVQYHKDGSPLSVLSSVRLIQDEESNLIQAIANNRDISERKRTEEALKRYLSALETLYENAVTISRLQEPKEVAQKIVDALVRYLSWHHVTVRLRRGESDELELVAFEQPGLSKQNRDRIAKKFAEMVNVVGQGLSGWAMQSGKLIRAANVREYPQFAETHPGIQSGMYAPLQVGERVIGVISVESETLNAFSEHDERLLAALAAQAAVAFDNARLYRDLQKELQERSRIEDALRQSEMQNRTILQTALDGFWLIEPESGRLLDVNDAYCQMSGYSRAELLQMTIAEVEVHETTQDVQSHSQKVLELGRDRFESVHRRKDGSTFQVEVSVQNLKNDGGRNFAFIHDITTRKQAEKALRKSEEQYRLLFDEMLSGFALHEIICNEKGQPVDYRFLAVNNAFEQLTGLKAEDSVGKTVLEVIPDLEPYWIERYGRVALEGVTDQFEGFNAAIGKHYEARAFCPEPGKFAVMFHDVTERKQAEEKLNQSLERLGLATRAARMGIWDWDIQENQLLWDDKMYDLYGVRKADFSGAYEAWLAGIHPEDRKSSDEVSRRARLGEVEYDTEFRVVWPDRSIHTIRALGQVIRDETGTPIRMTGINYDITAQRQSQERLKSLLQEKEILLAEVHHRVKNNLQIITSLLSLQARDITDERFRMAFEESRNRINSMALVHEQLYRDREYARIDLEGYIDQLATTLFNMYQIKPEKVKLEIEARDIFLELEKAIPCGLLLNELITNSLKYAFPGEKRGKLWIKLIPGDATMTLIIGDNGVGIPADFDLEASQSLGLQLVKLLAVHDLQGSVKISSKNGTEFRVEFPVQAPKRGVTS